MAVDRKQVKEYFEAPLPALNVTPVVIGAIMALCVFTVSVWGLVVCGIGVLAIFYQFKQFGAMKQRYNERPSDSQMDAWLEEDLKNMNKKALDKLGIDETEVMGDPVEITGPRVFNLGGAIWSYKKGNDNVLRFTPVDVCLINFTQNQLVSYTCALDLTTGNALNESTDEYFYKDVVSVATKTESRTGTYSTGEQLQLNSAEIFSLTTSGGTSISVVLSDPTLIQKMGGGQIPTTRAEKAINNIRKMLREKKA